MGFLGVVVLCTTTRLVGKLRPFHQYLTLSGIGGKVSLL